MKELRFTPCNRAAGLCLAWLLAVLLMGADQAFARFDVVAHYQTAAYVPITAASYNATGKIINIEIAFAPEPGATLTVINNTGIDFIQGEFANLAQGQVVEGNFLGAPYQFVANYYGGTGNDLVLVWANNKLMEWFHQTSRSAWADVPATGVLYGRTIIATSVSESCSLAVCSDGTVVAWGDNQFSQFGNTTNSTSDEPVPVVRSDALTGKTVIAVSVGYNHCLALCTDGSVVAWGMNEFGQLGIGKSSRIVGLPMAVTNTSGPLRGRKVVAISAGYQRSVALCSDGTVVRWGKQVLNSHGILRAPDLVPVLVDTSALGGRQVIAVETAKQHSVAVCSDGTLALWEYTGFGTASVPSLDLPTPVTLSGALVGKSIAAASSSSTVTSLLTSDGLLADWQGADVFKSIDLSRLWKGSTISAISRSDIRGLVLSSEGALFEWSDSSALRLATPYELPSGARIVSVRAGRSRFTDRSLIVVALPVKPVAETGTFSGLVRPTTAADTWIGASPDSVATEGLITMTVQSSGAFSGRLMLDGGVYPFAGKLNPNTDQATFGPSGLLDLVITRRNKSPVQLSFHRSTAYPAPATVLQGVISGSGKDRSVFTAKRQFFDAKTALTTVPDTYFNDVVTLANWPPRVTWAGPTRYTVLFPAVPSKSQPSGLADTKYPKGTGYGVGTIARNGGVTLAGHLADGSSFTTFTMLSRRPDIAFDLFLPLYAGRGFLSAHVILDSASLNSDFSAAPASVRWARPSLGTQHYPQGWPQVIVTNLVGAKLASKDYKSVVDPFDYYSFVAQNHNPVLAARVECNAGLLTGPFVRIINVSYNEVVRETPSPDPSFGLVINHASGIITGSFLPGNGDHLYFQGAAYQKGRANQVAQGYFLSATPKVKDYKGESGTLSVSAVP